MLVMPLTCPGLGVGEMAADVVAAEPCCCCCCGGGESAASEPICGLSVAGCAWGAEGLATCLTNAGLEPLSGFVGAIASKALAMAETLP